MKIESSMIVVSMLLFTSGCLLLLGSNPRNMAMAMAMAAEDELHSMALLPFGSPSAAGTFIRLPQCGGPPHTAPPSPSPPIHFNANAPNLMKEMVDVHNAARAQVNVEPIEWDVKVENYSQRYANQRIDDCKLIHSNGPYGENLAQGIIDVTGNDAVKLWLDEKQFYDYDTNTCASGKVCGHYTQVVWRNSMRIGCARVYCNLRGGSFIVCNYDPPGNVIGQRPY